MPQRKHKFRRPQLGDVFEFPLPTEFAYIQYVFDDSSAFPGKNHYGTLVRILSFRSAVSANSVQEIELDGDAFCCFSACNRAQRSGLARYLGNAPVPMKYQVRPAFKQHYTLDKREKKDIIWFLAAEKSGAMTRVGKLTPEQRSLPLLESVGVELLKERLENNWRPEDECE